MVFRSLFGYTWAASVAGLRDRSTGADNVLPELFASSLISGFIRLKVERKVT